MALTETRDDIGRQRETLDTLMAQIHAGYVEMPGLSLTVPQAQRLWAADRASCEQVFNHLIAAGVLRATARGRFVRA